jgi:apolipoprotein N-acyltransferase
MGAAAVAAIRERYFQALYAPIAATLFILVYGVVRLLTFSADQPPISVALLQGNISVGQKFDRANFQKNIQQYRSKSLSLGDQADLIVWPETVVQFALDGRLKQLPVWADPVLSVSHPVLFGTHVWDPDSNGQPRFHDSALLVGPDATVWGRYDKQVLMPFGEYMPLENVFPFLRKFDPNKTVYAEARPERSMATPLGIKIAPLICYDDLFPSIAREGVREGGQLLVAMNNDGWYGDTAALTQHDVLARWRAIESRRYFAKSDNVGITNVIDPLGRDVARLKPFVEDVLVAKVRPMSTITFYTRFGDLFAELVVLSLVILVVRQVSSRSRPPVRKKK